MREWDGLDGRGAKWVRVIRERKRCERPQMTPKREGGGRGGCADGRLRADKAGGAGRERGGNAQKCPSLLDAPAAIRRTDQVPRLSIDRRPRSGVRGGAVCHCCASAYHASGLSVALPKQTSPDPHRQAKLCPPLPIPDQYRAPPLPLAHKAHLHFHPYTKQIKGTYTCSI